MQLVQFFTGELRIKVDMSGQTSEKCTSQTLLDLVAGKYIIFFPLVLQSLIKWNNKHVSDI